MGIFDFLKSKSGSKINVRRYFDETNKELDLPKIAAAINSNDKEGNLSANFGKLKSLKKITIPPEATEELIKLDQLQEQLANAINGLRGEARQTQLVKYTDTLMKMMDIHLHSENYSKKKEISNSKVNQVDYTGFKKYLDNRNFKSTLVPDNLTSKQGYIIWPVVLLSTTTYIHKAQAKLIQQIVNSGWKLIVIIGDCGNQLEWRSSFLKEITSVLKANEIDIEPDTITFLSDYYQQTDGSQDSTLISGVTGTKILNMFHSISENIKWDLFDTLIKKNYDEIKQKDISKRTVLKNILPLLSWSLVSTIVKETSKNVILIAGEDEQNQWDHIANRFTNNRLGVIYIHELVDENGKTMDQELIKIRSIHELKSKLDIGNMAEWLFTHFIEIPKFSSPEKPEFCKISSNECTKYNNNCIQCLFGAGQNYGNKDFNKDIFIESIWPLANPANN